MNEKGGEEEREFVEQERPESCVVGERSESGLNVPGTECNDAGLAVLKPIFDEVFSDEDGPLIPEEFRDLALFYCVLLLAGIKISNIDLEIDAKFLRCMGFSQEKHETIYEMLRELGYRAAEIRDRLARKLAEKYPVRVMAADFHTSVKYGKNLPKYFDTKRNGPRRCVAAHAFAAVDQEGQAQFVLLEPQFIHIKGYSIVMDRLDYIEEVFGKVTLYMDGEYGIKKICNTFCSKDWPFITRLHSNATIIKPVRNHMEKFGLDVHDEWIEGSPYGGHIHVIGLKKDTKFFFWATNLEGTAEELLERYRLRWRIENGFRDNSFLDQTPGCHPDKLRGHFLLCHVAFEITRAFRSMAETVRRLLRRPGTIRFADARCIITLKGPFKKWHVSRFQNFSNAFQHLGISFRALQPVN